MNNNFDELTLKEKSEVTEDQLAAFEAYHMMTAGVPMLMVDEPKETIKPEVTTKTFYSVNYGRYGSDEACFKTIEEAQTFSELRPLHVENEYSIDTKWVRESKEITIKTVQYMSEEDYKKFKTALDNYGSDKRQYEKEKKEYDVWFKQKSDILQGLRDEWYSAKSHAEKMKRISQTFTAYIRTANGNRDIALNFLHKAYTIEQVAEATTWFDGELEFKEEVAA